MTSSAVLNTPPSREDLARGRQRPWTREAWMLLCFGLVALLAQRELVPGSNLLMAVFVMFAAAAVVAWSIVVNPPARSLTEQQVKRLLGLAQIHPEVAEYLARALTQGRGLVQADLRLVDAWLCEQLTLPAN